MTSEERAVAIRALNTFITIQEQEIERARRDGYEAPSRAQNVKLAEAAREALRGEREAR